MTQIKFAVQIVDIERLNCSVNGNPRFNIVFDDKLSWMAELTTQSDNGLNYEIGNPGFRVGDWVKIETTRAGRISAIKTAQAPEYVR